MDFNEKQIKKMQDEFLKLQKIELAIDSEQGKTSRLIDNYAVTVKSYSDISKLEKLIAEAESIIEEIRNQGQVRGTVMSLKTMDTYLEKAERTTRTQKMLDIIARNNKKRAQRRLSVYIDEMLRDANIMKADIAIFRKQGKLSGLSDREINKLLAEAAMNDASPINAFGKRLKTLEKAVLRRESVATEIDEYRKHTKVNEKWQWVAVSSGPCPDCKIRAGKILTFDRWTWLGLPGAGRTICRGHCMCKLMPVSVAEDLFPKVKSFKWNKESGVLTTFKDMKTLKK